MGTLEVRLKNLLSGRRWFACLLLAVACLLTPIRPASHPGHASDGARLPTSRAFSAEDRLLASVGELYHWPRLPMRVYITPESQSDQPWTPTTIAGFDEWVRATGGVVGYSRVNSPSQAQITVRFVPTPTVPGHEGLVGLTTLYWDGPVLQKAEIILATGDKSRSDVQTAAAHEFGHALGIRGHSDNPDDLMFPAPIRETPDGKHPETAHPVTGRDLTILRHCYPTLFGLADPDQ